MARLSLHAQRIEVLLRVRHTISLVGSHNRISARVHGAGLLDGGGEGPRLERVFSLLDLKPQIGVK